jgi:aminopeptidase N
MGVGRAASRRGVVLAAILMLVAGSAVAATAARLPATVVPERYVLDLHPDLGAALLRGSERVDIVVTAPTRRIVLNAVAIDIGRVTLDGAAGTVTLDAAAETAGLDFPATIAAGRHRLEIAFTAHINGFGRGLFAVTYPTEHGPRQMLGTQLEPADARRVFPCWDEPAFKARFETTVTVPGDFTAVSNMPVRSETDDSGMKRIAFEATPAMSSYLFVLVAGELERVSGVSDGVTVSVVTVAGKSAQGRYALDVAIRLLAYYDRYFAVPYALPKLDLIAIPGGFAGAMENWGAITFYEPLLLFDPAADSRARQRDIFSVVAHEMSHQWFGDLVTMAWWDDLWLNEGFASWMQDKARDALEPQQHVWLDSAGATRGAMVQDARAGSHPIEQKIADASEANTAFDSITYRKGRALIRQLESFLGEDRFRAGIRRYIKAHAGANATTADLWRALAAATGEDIAALAGPFTRVPGFPMITSTARCVTGRQVLRLTQHRFLIDGTAPAQLWQVPIALGPPDGSTARTVLLRGEAADVTTGRCGAPIKLNLGAVGYYRVRYDDATAAALAQDFAKMPAEDRVNLLDDAWALVDAARAPPAGFFALVDAAKGDETRAVWDMILSALDRIDRIEAGRPHRAAFATVAQRWLRPAFDPLGWDERDGEDPDRAILRVRLIGALGRLGDADIIAEAQRRFAAFAGDPATLRPALRDVVVRIAAREADQATWETLLALARRTTRTSERRRYYAALGAARDPALAARALDLALGENLPPDIARDVVMTVADAGEHPDLAWDFVRAHYAALAQQQGPSFADFFVAGLFRNFSDDTHRAVLHDFAPAHATPGARIAAARAEEAIALDARFADRQLPPIDAWIAGR